ncbi:MAG: 2-oxoacid:acceptor oxidoreductase family protein [Patescibacteria group bacterium]
MKKAPDNKKEINKILIAGEGGQGVQTIAHLICEAAFHKGLAVSFIPNYGVEQRGGVSLAFIQIQDKPVHYPKFEKGDLVVILSERSVLRTWQYVGPESLVLYNSSFITPKLLNSQKPRVKNLLGIDAANLAAFKLKSSRVFNVIILGAILGRLGKITFSEMKSALKKQLGKKYKAKPELEALNNDALKMGIELVK